MGDANVARAAASADALRASADALRAGMACAEAHAQIDHERALSEYTRKAILIHAGIDRLEQQRLHLQGASLWTSPSADIAALCSPPPSAMVRPRSPPQSPAVGGFLAGGTSEAHSSPCGVERSARYIWSPPVPFHVSVSPAPPSRSTLPASLRFVNSTSAPRLNAEPIARGLESATAPRWRAGSPVTSPQVWPPFPAAPTTTMPSGSLTLPPAARIRSPSGSVALPSARMLSPPGSLTVPAAVAVPARVSPVSTPMVPAPSWLTATPQLVSTSQRPVPAWYQH
jgi:hypothetical protein